MKVSTVYKVLPVFIFSGDWFTKLKFYRYAGGITIFNITVMHPNLHKDSYISLLEHEKVHCEQSYRYLGFNSLMYLTSAGRLMLEIEAYCRQYSDTELNNTYIINTLDSYYKLKYTKVYILNKVYLYREKLRRMNNAM